MRRQGPPFLHWLLAKVAYPTRPGSCTRCGVKPVEQQAAFILKQAGDPLVGAFSELCHACRRELLARELR